MFVDRSDQNAPNQAMLMSRTIIDGKRDYLTKGKHAEVLDNFTIDSPIPFVIADVIARLEELDAEMISGQGQELKSKGRLMENSAASWRDSKISRQTVGLVFFSRHRRRP